MPATSPRSSAGTSSGRVQIPVPIKGYVARPELESLCALTDRRLTVLHAPGGFGKTTVLAHRCQALREEGLAVAWLSLDEADGPDSLAAYLVLAFEAAGLSAFQTLGGRSQGGGAQPPAPAAHSQADYPINLLIRTIERHGAPCVLALDEVERLTSVGAVEALNALLGRAPRNLHVGMALRDPPPALDIAMFALEGQAEILTVDLLRFSRPDIARFFDPPLSRRELASVVTASQGWPLALRIHGIARRAGTADLDHGAGGITLARWIETRLWRGVLDEDRDFVLDIALFERLDPELIDEVTGAGNSARRIASMGALAGLVSSTGGSPTVKRLHPLVKDYCERRRFEEDAERFRTLHRGIAGALERRGQYAEALRHATEANDAGFLGGIAERTGGVSLCLEQGLEMLRTLNGLLTPELIANYPRLALVRCVALTLSGDINAAQCVYQAAAQVTDSFTRDREGGDDRALRTDHVLVLGLLNMCGCRPWGGRVLETIDRAEAIANAPETATHLRGIMSLGICIAHNHTTAFQSAVAWAKRARATLARASPYLAYVELQAGSIAMARGRTSEAQASYDRAMETAQASHLNDAGAVIIGQALAAELELERVAGTPPVDRPRVSPQFLGECAAWLDIYAASIGVQVELALLNDGPAAALKVAEDALDYARRTERPALARWLAALRVSVLLDGGDVAEADRAWRFDGLPEDPAGCTDLTIQGWREAEMLGSARLRLLAALRHFDAARQVGGALRTLASERGLVRTRMRALALLMALERRASRSARAQAHLAEYLRLFAEADYVRPLARERTAAVALLDDLAEGRGADAATASDAARLRRILAGDTGASQRRARGALNHREMEVLTRLELYSDREIAEALNLSYEGVRSRIRGIFRKLGAHRRLHAVSRARALGHLPPPGESPRAHS